MPTFVHLPAVVKTHKEQSIIHGCGTVHPMLTPANPVVNGKPDPDRFLNKATILSVHQDLRHSW